MALLQPVLKQQKITKTVIVLVIGVWLRGMDSNHRPSGYERVSIGIAEFGVILLCVVGVSLSVKFVILCLC